jgi:hydrogenase nickel incorporation protein HypB
MEITILKDILGTNKETAAEVKALLDSKGIYMVDIMSSPGSGKTTLTEKIVVALKSRYRIAVIEGDIKTTKDSERIARHGVPVIQIETDRFGGDCHLESSWIMKCLASFDLDNLDFILIENIGNLVCPAEFELGDDERVVVLSVTEGEDKPAKYPLVFNTSATLIVNKIDLLPHLDFDMNELKTNVDKVNPAIRSFHVSATTGEGMDSLINHFAEQIDKKKKH